MTTEGSQTGEIGIYHYKKVARGNGTVAERAGESPKTPGN